MFSDGVNSLKELANQRKARASDLSGNTGARRVRVTAMPTLHTKKLINRHLSLQISNKPEVKLYSTEPTWLQLTRCCYTFGSFSFVVDILQSVRCLFGIRVCTYLLFFAPLFYLSLGCTICYHGNWQCLNIAPLKSLIELDCDVDLSLKFTAEQLFARGGSGD